MTLKLVIFDCDGTLHNSVGGIELGLKHAFAQNGLDMPDVTGLGRRLAQPMGYIIPQLLGHKATDELTKSVLATYETYMDNKPIGALYEGITDVLSKLQSRNYLMAMVTGMGDGGC